MRYDFCNTGAGAAPVETTEERMTKNERNRVLGYIRAYAKNPSSPRWSPQMVLKLQQMADTYDIPWSPQKPDPGFLKKGAAALGGVIDAALLDFIPDKAYTAPGTEGWAEAGKWASLPAQIALAVGTGGATAAVRGATWGATKALGKGALARKAAGMTLGGGLVKAAQPAVAPLLNRFGVAKGSKYVTEGVKKITTKSKKAAVAELQTLRGGADNARVVELLRSGVFSPKEIRGITASIVGKGGTATGRKLAADALLEQVLPGGVGGKLTGAIINKLAKAPKKVLNELKGRNPLNTKRKVKAWVDGALKGTSRVDKDAIIKEIVESDAQTLKELLSIGAKMSGKAKTALSVGPDLAGALPSTLGLGALGMMGTRGQDPDIDPLRPYYSATSGQ